MESTNAKRKSNTGLWVVLGVLSLVLMFSMVLNAGLAMSLFAKGVAGGTTAGKSHHLLAKGHPEDEEPVMNEVWSFGHGSKKVLRLAVEGIIMRETEGGFFDVPQDKIENILAQIRAAKNDDDIRGIILEVDSPGGGVTPSDEIYAALKAFKDSDDKRKVLVFVRDLAASGGYYVAMAGDWIVAEPTAIIGSIGVIMGSMNFKGLAEKAGVKDVTIKSGKNKDLLNPFAEIDTNQIAIIQRMIDATYERFFGIVKENRQIKEGQLRELADGRVFDAGEALKLRLVDEIGYWDDAIEKMAGLLGEKDVKVVRYETHVNVLDRLLGIETRAHSPAQMIESFKEAARPKMQYLWQP